MHTKHLWLLLDLNGSYFDALCRHVYLLMSAGSKNVLHQSTDPNTVGDPSLSLSLHFYDHYSRRTWVSRYQNVSILDFVGAKGDGSDGDSSSYKMCKVSVKLLPPTNW